jgi:hypothetical protein
MKRRFWVAGIICMAVWLAEARGQDHDAMDTEKYLKSNIAFGNGRVLGLSDTRYARSIEAVDYAEPGRKIMSVEIDGVEYADDGKGFDLVEADGILTSVMSYSYLEFEKAIPIGEYRRIRENFVMHDRSFEHDVAGKLVVEVACDMNFVPCSQGGNCKVCELNIWPYGCVRVRNCRVRVVWEW